MRTIQIEHLGQTYLWNGSAWTDERFLRPPSKVRSVLMHRMVEQLRDADPDTLDKALVIQAARSCIDEGHVEDAQALAERVLEVDPRHVEAATVLATVLRGRRLPRRAIRATDSFQRRRNSALLTVRAAAYCDISDWDRAETLVRRAIAIDRSDASPETLHVFARVLSARARDAA